MSLLPRRSGHYFEFRFPAQRKSKNRDVYRNFGREMIEFDASFIYGSTLLIIDFGPDDPEAEQKCSTGELWSERKA